MRRGIVSIGIVFVCLVFGAPNTVVAGDFVGLYAYPSSQENCANIDDVKVCVPHGVKPTSYSTELVVWASFTNEGSKNTTVEFDSFRLDSDLSDRKIIRRSVKQVIKFCQRPLAFPLKYARQLNKNLLPDQFYLQPGETQEGYLRFFIANESELRKEKRSDKRRPCIFKGIVPFQIKISYKGTLIDELGLAIHDKGGSALRFYISDSYEWDTVRFNNVKFKSVVSIWGNQTARLFEFSDKSVLLITDTQLFCSGVATQTEISFVQGEHHLRKGWNGCPTVKRGVRSPQAGRIIVKNGERRLIIDGLEASLELLSSNILR